MLQELNLQEMNEIKGGIPVEEYCDILISLYNKENVERWGGGEHNAFWDAWNTHCS